jgi:NTP pyrophosphatase (non-canonical NTP hydrolase)
MKQKLSTSSPTIANEMLAEVPAGLNDLACAIYERNVEKGFYEKPKNIGEMLCLIHSEVSEALEADRKNKYALTNMQAINRWVQDADFVEHYKEKVKGTFEEEMADIFIRVLDMCAFKGIDIEQHVKAKMRYNLTREKYHGKKY